MGFETLKFMCGAQYDNFILASCLEFNGLYKVYFETGESECLGIFPNESLICNSLHRTVFIINDYAYFIPYKATNMHIYDIKKKEISELVIERNGYKGGYLGVQKNEHIYLVPESEGGEILEIDTRTESTRKLVMKDKLSEITNKININSKLLFLRICLQNNRLWLPLHNTGIIFEVEISTGEIAKHNLAINNIIGCFNGKSGVWILGDGGKSVYKWDFQLNSIIKMFEDCKYTQKIRCFNWIIDVGQNVYVLPAWGENILIQKDDGFVVLENVNKGNGGYQKFFEPICSNGSIYLLPMGIEYMIRIQGNAMQKISLDKMDSESVIYQDILHAYIKESSREGIRESQLSLRQFIDGVTMTYN